MSDAELARKRADFGTEIASHPMDDDYHRARSAKWDKIVTPLFSAANWGGQGLHPRGNFEGFVRAASKQKWLEAHGIEHWTHFYTDYGREQQLRFFDYFLHGKKEGWAKQPKVLLQVRHIDKFAPRAESEWPLKRTRWTKFYLDPSAMTLTTKKPSGTAQLKFAAMSDGLTFLTPPLAKETEITGPSALKLFASSSTSDADFFIVLRVFTGDLKEIVFQGAIDPHTPDRTRMVACIPPQARQEIVEAIPALSHARRKAAFEKEPGRGTRRRNLADVDRRSGRLPRRPVDPRQRTMNMAGQAAASCQTSRTN